MSSGSMTLLPVKQLTLTAGDFLVFVMTNRSMGTKDFVLDQVCCHLQLNVLSLIMMSAQCYILTYFRKP